MRELLIVVGIIMIIAVIYVPKLVLSKMVANEASAVTSLRKLNTACITYSTTYGGYPKTLANLRPANRASSAADLIDPVLASGVMSEYSFVYTPGATDSSGNVLSYTIAADPRCARHYGTAKFFHRPVRGNSVSVVSARIYLGADFCLSSAILASSERT